MTWTELLDLIKEEIPPEKLDSDVILDIDSEHTQYTPDSLEIRSLTNVSPLFHGHGKIQSAPKFRYSLKLKAKQNAML